MLYARSSRRCRRSSGGLADDFIAFGLPAKANPTTRRPMARR